jgi:VWFA-related protein
MAIDRRFSSRVVAIGALIFSVFICAKPQDKEDKSVPSFTIRSELVLIPTLVTDRSGNHIRGLRKEDFTLLENSTPQKIATFEEIVSDDRRLSRPENPNEFSNSLAGEPSPRQIVLMVLDFINTSVPDQAAARHELLRYLTESVAEREPTVLYTLTRSGIHVIYDFAGDPAALAAALRNAFQTGGNPMSDSPEAAAVIIGQDGSVNSGNAMLAKGRQAKAKNREQDWQANQQNNVIADTLEAMQQLAQAWAGIPGRKSLIWAGDGFPFNASDHNGSDSLGGFLSMYKRTLRLLNEAQIALYPVDIAGIQVADSASVRGGAAAVGDSAASQEQDIWDRHANLRSFASMTGGLAYFNSNDLVKAFRDAADDSNEYYMLGYYLDRSKFKPGWVNLGVKVRLHHAEVRARSGFFVTNTTTDPENSPGNDVLSALQSPLDYTSIALVARWDKIEPGIEPGKKHVNYEMRVAPDSALIDVADNNHLVLNLVALARTPEGKVADDPSWRVDIHLSSEKVSAIRREGVDYRGALDLAPGEYTVRFVVRDGQSGRIGSVTAPLKVQ